MITLACSTLMLGGLGLGIATTSSADTMPVSETQSQVKGWESALVDPTFNDLSNWNGAQALGQKIEKQENAIRVTAINSQISLGQKGSMIANHDFEPLMTKVTRFLGIEHTCKRISLLTAVSLIYQAIPVVPTVFDDWI